MFMQSARSLYSNKPQIQLPKKNINKLGFCQIVPSHVYFTNINIITAVFYEYLQHLDVTVTTDMTLEPQHRSDKSTTVWRTLDLVTSQLFHTSPGVASLGSSHHQTENDKVSTLPPDSTPHGQSVRPSEAAGSDVRCLHFLHLWGILVL